MKSLNTWDFKTFTLVIIMVDQCEGFLDVIELHMRIVRTTRYAK
jgi:hypothetical protein